MLASAHTRELAPRGPNWKPEVRVLRLERLLLFQFSVLSSQRSTLRSGSLRYLHRQPSELLSKKDLAGRGRFRSNVSLRAPLRALETKTPLQRPGSGSGKEFDPGDDTNIEAKKQFAISADIFRRARAAGVGLIPKLLQRRPRTRLVQSGSWHDFADDPVLLAMHERRAHGSRPGHRRDPYRIGLVIEGGGMRGSIAAGMCAALGYLGFDDTFDVVFGSSAGAICGAYLISRQLPVYGPSIYFEDIANKRFIDTRALLRASRTQHEARPVLDLDFLLDEVMVHTKPLDWPKFAQRNELQPLRPVASSLRQAKSVAFRGFTSYTELRECLRASARVPGIAGPLVQIGDDVFADGILFEAIPYRSALADACTHVLVLRTRPIGTRVPRIAGFYERMIAAPELKSFPHIRDYIIRGGHFQQYLRDIRLLEDLDQIRHAHVPNILGEQWMPHLPTQASLLPIGPLRGDKEISQLETRPEVIFEATRYGFELAFEMLTAPYRRPIGDGARFARMVFSDERLEEILHVRASIRRQLRDVKQDSLALKRLQRIWFLRRFRKGSQPDASAAQPSHHFVTDDYLSSLQPPRNGSNASSLGDSKEHSVFLNGETGPEPSPASKSSQPDVGGVHISDRSDRPGGTETTKTILARSKRDFLFLPRLAGLRLIQKKSR
ncbi:hypothetical protein CCYA_CCYA06G1767 [Cyanidiococcus yangmingshanensis]|nr:hypothetical protein CCYA_CCYA06G1767 [Cyanidiococcus yangmingshanensis]